MATSWTSRFQQLIAEQARDGRTWQEISADFSDALRGMIEEEASRPRFAQMDPDGNVTMAPAAGMNRAMRRSISRG